MIHTGIIGASGYSGEELVRLILHHPRVKLSFVTSRQNAGKSLAEVFPKFAGFPGARRLKFIDPGIPGILKALGGQLSSCVVFLAVPHGAAPQWAVPLLKKRVRVIDLSADFRLKNPATYHDFYGHVHPTPDLLKHAVYGLPEVYRTEIRKARLIASPGCYPTSILLPLIPLLKEKLIDPQGLIVNSLSGVSGAGRKAEESFLFCECNESARAYGIPKHRHLSEIEQELGRAVGKRVVIQFTPHLIPMNRGILTTIYAHPLRDLGEDFSKQVERCLQKAYGREPFVRLLASDFLPDTKNVCGTNVIEIAHRFDPRTRRLVLVSAEDNLIKGASGQAVQSMNILCRFPEMEGLV